MIELDGPNATVSPAFTFPPANGELLVLEFDFKTDAQNYFATRVGVPMAGKTLADAIAFNNANADAEMPFFAQEIFDETVGAAARGGHPADRSQLRPDEL